MLLYERMGDSHANANFISVDLNTQRKAGYVPNYFLRFSEVTLLYYYSYRIKMKEIRTKCIYCHLVD